MNLCCFKETFKKFGYKKRGRTFFKVSPQDKNIIISFLFEEICHGTVLRITAAFNTMIFGDKCWVYNCPVLQDIKNNYLPHAIEDEYTIKYISDLELQDNINEIKFEMEHKVLPFFDNLPLKEPKFYKEYLIGMNNATEIVISFYYFYHDCDRAIMMLEKYKTENELTVQEKNLYEALKTKNYKIIEDLINKKIKRFKLINFMLCKSLKIV